MMDKEQDIVASQAIDIGNIRTVCLALGPYRNLTTLTASILFLHPNCQVLNHAGERIFGDHKLDFLKQYSDATFDNFLRYAIQISQGGKRGAYGGSITLSHAFDEEHDMQDLFQSTGGKLLKENVESVFWKESLLISRYIRANAVDPSDLFARNKKLRFLLPVRNPIDCAASNLKTGHVTYFGSLNEDSNIEQVIDAILDEFAWFEDLRARFPDRFFTFFAHEFGPATLDQLAAFLRLPASDDWVRNAVRAFNLKGSYPSSTQLLAHYRNSVETKFSRHPDFQQRLLAFIRGI